MQIISGHENLEFETRTVATIGTFDGIHLGHQRIIENMAAAAAETGFPSLLLTFDVHPRQILAPKKQTEILMTLDEKLMTLVEFNLDFVCVLNFKEISTFSAEDFCRLILIDKAKVTHLFIGANFRFGAGATGDVDWLKTNCPSDFKVTEFPLETLDGNVVSSTKVRDLFKTGQVEKIPQLLGRHIALSGRVVRGAGRGFGLGFPTANLEFSHDLCLPSSGVYTGYLWVEDQRLPAVINCGTNPTFEDGLFHCEAHVLDYHTDLYGEKVRLEFATRLRDERKFPSPEALSRQITDDIHHAKAWFAHQKTQGA